MKYQLRSRRINQADWGPWHDWTDRAEINADEHWKAVLDSGRIIQSSVDDRIVEYRRLNPLDILSCGHKIYRYEMTRDGKFIGHYPICLSAYSEALPDRVWCPDCSDWIAISQEQSSKFNPPRFFS